MRDRKGAGADAGRRGARRLRPARRGPARQRSPGAGDRRGRRDRHALARRLGDAGRPTCCRRCWRTSTRATRRSSSTSRSRPRAGAMELVRTHRVELAVLGGLTAPAELESEPLIDDEVVARRAAALAGRRLRAKELEGETWISTARARPPAATSRRRVGRSGCATCGRSSCRPGRRSSWPWRAARASRRSAASRSTRRPTGGGSPCSTCRAGV